MTETRTPRLTLFVLALAAALYFFEQATTDHKDSWMFYADCFVAIWALMNAAVLAWEGLKND